SRERCRRARCQNAWSDSFILGSASGDELLAAPGVVVDHDRSSSPARSGTTQRTRCDRCGKGTPTRTGGWSTLFCLRASSGARESATRPYAASAARGKGRPAAISSDRCEQAPRLLTHENGTSSRVSVWGK